MNNAETRAVKTAWAAGDKIYVVFDVCFQEEMASYLTLTYNGYSWSSEFSDDTLEELLLGRKLESLRPHTFRRTEIPNSSMCSIRRIRMFPIF